MSGMSQQMFVVLLYSKTNSNEFLYYIYFLIKTTITLFFNTAFSRYNHYVQYCHIL